MPCFIYKATTKNKQRVQSGETTPSTTPWGQHTQHHNLGEKTHPAQPTSSKLTTLVPQRPTYKQVQHTASHRRPPKQQDPRSEYRTATRQRQARASTWQQRSTSLLALLRKCIQHFIIILIHKKTLVHFYRHPIAFSTVQRWCCQRHKHMHIYQ
jgi:hypothetical protein